MSILLLLTACWLPQKIVDERLDAFSPDGPVEDTDGADDTDIIGDVTDSNPFDTDETGGTGPPLPECADERVTPGSVPWTRTGTTDGAGDDEQATCIGLASVDDYALAWTVPADGCYILSTARSAFDTVMYILDDCRTQIACSDDAYVDFDPGPVDRTDNSTVIHKQLSGGQDLTVVIDGFSAEHTGSFQLKTVRGQELPWTIDGGAAIGEIASGDNSAEDLTLRPDDCPFGSGGRDVLIRWTAPFTDWFTFTTKGSDFDTTLSLHRLCAEEAVVCTDHIGPGGVVPEEITMSMTSGEEVVLRVAGASFGGGVFGSGTWVLGVSGSDIGAR